MTSIGWKWKGARWWKFDFHTHSPASADYGKGSHQAALKRRKPREWLLDFMAAGLDCVAITDHNSGQWIEPLQTALGELGATPPEGYRPLTLFPGVEISVHGGIHILAILDPSKTTSDIDSLLGAVGFEGSKGNCADVTTKSPVQVIEKIESAGGIAIPAHVDQLSGLFELQGASLDQVLRLNSMIAMEVTDPAVEKPALYRSRKTLWAEILGSDAHHPTGGEGQRFPGSHFTWVKMGQPSLAGLRLALLDGDLSIQRSDRLDSDPNAHAALTLECLEVRAARYMGRGKPFRVGLNPWLNAIIGGRGTGKSSLVEFLRIVMRRENELSDALFEDTKKYRNIYRHRGEDGLLTKDSYLCVTILKDKTRFRLQWNGAGDVEPIEQQDSEDGSWHPAEGEIPHRFPVRIFSQKQIFQLAKDPLSLLQIVDDAPEVERSSWNQHWEQEKSRFLSLRARAREIEAGFAEEPRLRGELADTKRRIEIFESAGHAEVLKSFQRTRRQLRSVEAWEETWQDSGAKIRNLSEELLAETLDHSGFNPESARDSQLLEATGTVRRKLEAIRRSLEELAREADEVLAAWRVDVASSPWRRHTEETQKAYATLAKELKSAGAGEPDTYGELVQKRQSTEQRLNDLVERRKQVIETQRQADASLGRLLHLRRRLTDLRSGFLEKVLSKNQYVRIVVSPYGSKQGSEAEFRKLLQREAGGFEKDIGAPSGGGLLGDLFASEDIAEVEQALAKIKSDLRAAGSGDIGGMSVRDQRFATHLEGLAPEVFDRLDSWFPEDSLDVQYSATSDGQHFRSIQEGSPGQKTAALLAFLLSYGDEPLVLDQPEDDLDNHLIYDLIVAQLRSVKRHRQLLVVTHNANIVVNGDAELVHALIARGGETQKECSGGLQDSGVRAAICDVMEGGREAFEKRYRRIALGGRRHV